MKTSDRILVCAVGLALGSTCVLQNVHAQVRPRSVQPLGSATDESPRALSGGASSQTKADYGVLPRGNTITSGGRTYVVLPDVRAVPSDPGQEPARLQVMERKGRFLLYRESRPQMRSSAAATVQDATLTGQPLLSHAVVLNPRTGRAGVVLGTIMVKLADMSQADAVSAAHRLTLSSRFDHLGLAIYTAGPGQDIASATAALRADARVTAADPEILENARMPK